MNMKNKRCQLKSDVNFKIKNSKGKLKIILESANADFEIDDGDQSERFMDKDWETETVIPTLKLTDKKKRRVFLLCWLLSLFFRGGLLNHES